MGVGATGMAWTGWGGKDGFAAGSDLGLHEANSTSSKVILVILATMVHPLGCMHQMRIAQLFGDNPSMPNPPSLNIVYDLAVVDCAPWARHAFQDMPAVPGRTERRPHGWDGGYRDLVPRCGQEVLERRTPL